MLRFTEKVMEGYGWLIHPLTWISVLTVVLVGTHCHGELRGHQDILEALAQGRVLDGHAVAVDAERLQTPYLGQSGVLAYEAWGEELITDLDNPHETRIIEERSERLGFHVVGRRSGVVASGSSATVVQDPNRGAGKTREEGDITWHERVVRPGDRASVRGAETQDSAGRPELVGPVQIYRGTPARWRHEVLGEASWALTGAVVFWLLSVLSGWVIYLWVGGFVLDRQVAPSPRLFEGAATMAPSEVVGRLRSLDVRDAIDEAPGVCDASTLRFWWLMTSLGAALIVLGTWWLAQLMPALRSLTPTTSDAAFGQAAFEAVLVAGGLAALLWLIGRVRWARGLVRAAEARGRCAELLLQVLGRLSAALDQSRALEFKRVHNGAGRDGWSVIGVMRAGEAIQVSVDATATSLTVQVTWDAREPVAVSAERPDEASGWVSSALGGEPVGDEEVYEALADALVGGVRTRGVQVSGRLRSVAPVLTARLRRGSGVGVAADRGGARRLRLVARESFALPELEEPERGLWWRANADALWQLGQVGAVVTLAPLVSALLWAGRTFWGWELVVEGLGLDASYLVAAPLAVLLPAIAWFEPVEVSVRRRRRLLVRHEALEFDGRVLTRAADRIDLDKPFVMHLTREPAVEAAETMLGVELVQGQGVAASRLRVSVPLELTPETEGLPELVHSGPLVAAGDAVGWLWPLLCAALAQHGTPSAWELSVSDG